MRRRQVLAGCAGWTAVAAAAQAKAIARIPTTLLQTSYGRSVAYGTKGVKLSASQEAHLDALAKAFTKALHQAQKRDADQSVQAVADAWVASVLAEHLARDLHIEPSQVLRHVEWSGAGVRIETDRTAFSAAAAVVNGMRDDLAAPLGGRVFFAGEATMRRDFSSAHGALLSGQRAAAQLQHAISL